MQSPSSDSRAVSWQYQIKVAKLGAGSPVQQDIGRAHIAMYAASTVCVLQRFTDLQDHLDSLRLVQAPQE
ncbi:hypothetical protein BVG81_009725 [Haliangium sp. UPWRP_2]|nr:hypothetical protein BVG81_009725 [Haliangium sp. UPWRP_2]